MFGAVLAAALMLPAPQPAESIVFVSGANRLNVVDVATGEAQSREMKSLAACGPELVVDEGRVVFAGMTRRRTTVMSLPLSLEGRPLRLGNAHAFVPSAAPGRVWLAGTTCTLAHMTGARELTVDGTETVASTRRLPRGWLAAAVPSGLVLVQRRRPQVWSPADRAARRPPAARWRRGRSRPPLRRLRSPRALPPIRRRRFAFRESPCAAAAARLHAERIAAVLARRIPRRVPGGQGAPLGARPRFRRRGPGHARSGIAHRPRLPELRLVADRAAACCSERRAVSSRPMCRAPRSRRRPRSGSSIGARSRSAERPQPLPASSASAAASSSGVFTPVTMLSGNATRRGSRLSTAALSAPFGGAARRGPIAAGL